MSDFQPHTFPVAPGRYVYLFSHKKKLLNFDHCYSKKETEQGQNQKRGVKISLSSENYRTLTFCTPLLDTGGSLEVSKQLLI